MIARDISDVGKCWLVRDDIKYALDRLGGGGEAS